MANGQDEPRRDESFIEEINARLVDAARRGVALEVVLAVRGRVEPVPGRHGERWRVRTARGNVVTFRPEFVIAFSGATELGTK